jgi:hypothetical protein
MRHSVSSRVSPERRRRTLAALGTVGVLLGSLWTVAAAMAAARPPLPRVPGRVTQRMAVAFAGPGSVYEAVASAVREPGAKHRPGITQDYLSVFQLVGGAWHLVMRSPGRGLAARAVVPNAHRVYAMEMAVRLVGAAAFTRPGRQDLVVSTWATGADCGSTTLSVVALDGRTFVRPVAFRNPCSFTAQVRGREILIDAPYYAPTAALCCPTRDHVRVTITYDQGRRAWRISPPLFRNNLST